MCLTRVCNNVFALTRTLSQCSSSLSYRIQPAQYSDLDLTAVKIRRLSLGRDQLEGLSCARDSTSFTCIAYLSFSIARHSRPSKVQSLYLGFATRVNFFFFFLYFLNSSPNRWNGLDRINVTGEQKKINRLL